MTVRIVRTGSRVPVKIWTDDVEDEAIEQLLQMANMPFVYRHVAAMPDVHPGAGATIGSVVAMRDAVIPAAVDVDIGCGMLAARTSLTASDIDEKSLRRLFDQLSKDVPVGFASHPEATAPYSLVFDLMPRLGRIVEKHPEIMKIYGRPALDIALNLGVGGGNHFLEVCLDDLDRVWMMLHSGSRGIGAAIGRYFISLAKKEMERWMINLPHKDLAYLPVGSQYFDDYIEAVGWAQDYAMVNRQSIFLAAEKAMRQHLPAFVVTGEVINCHHNYVSLESHYGANVYVTRKGAIRARDGEMGIIPGSMGTRSYIVRGKGNKESFCSCSHGAGRRMTRNAALKLFTADDLVKQTDGVICRKDSGIVDEIPSSYKDIDVVMANQDDLVDAVHTLKQVLCLKGSK